MKAVLLDIDGTLIDSNDAHAAAWTKAFAEAGIEADDGAVRRLIGMGGDRVIPEIAGFGKETPSGKHIEERRGVIFREDYLPSLKPLPGAQDLLEKLKAEGFRLVVATSASEEDMKALLDQAGLAGLMDAAANGSDAPHSKPAPDIVEAALRAGRVGPDSAVMLGDTPYDVAAALAAGVKIIAFTSGGWSRGSLKGAVAVYEGPEDLLKNFEQSPLH